MISVYFMPGSLSLHFKVSLKVKKCYSASDAKSIFLYEALRGQSHNLLQKYFKIFIDLND